jgi:hypothetical protein
MPPEPPAVVAEASDPLEAAIWVDALRAAGVEAVSFERGVGSALGGAVAPGWSRFPVLVPAADLGTARNVIAELAGGAALAPYRDAAASRKFQRRLLLVMAGVAVAIVVAGVIGRVVAG